jgi:hypothetical protein
VPPLAPELLPLAPELPLEDEELELLEELLLVDVPGGGSVLPGSVLHAESRKPMPAMPRVPTSSKELRFMCHSSRLSREQLRVCSTKTAFEKCRKRAVCRVPELEIVDRSNTNCACNFAHLRAARQAVILCRGKHVENVELFVFGLGE